MKCAIPIWLVILAIGWTTCINVHAEETVVDLFEAVDRGDVDVRFIPMNAERANVVITNQTNQPLQLRMPNAIAAVPVLGQFGQNQGFGQNQNQGFGQNQNQGFGQNQGGGSQGVGGGFDQGNGQLGNGQNRFGMMRIAPGKARKLKAKTVCLEHGKPDPKPRMAYRMIPLESYTDDPIVLQVCQQLGTAKISQQVAQAIVWHRENGLTWTQLADLDRMQSKYRGNIKFFRSEELASAESFVKSHSTQNHPTDPLSTTSATGFVTTSPSLRSSNSTPYGSGDGPQAISRPAND